MGGTRKNTRKPVNERKPRDYAIEQDLWQDNDVIHAGCREQLVQAGHLAALMQNKDAVARVRQEDMDQLLAIGKRVGRDSRQLGEKLNEIHRVHVERRDAFHKARPVRRHLGMDAQELMEAATVGEAYSNWQQTHMNTVLPDVIAGVMLFNPDDRPALPGVPTNPATPE